MQKQQLVLRSKIIRYYCESEKKVVPKDLAVKTRQVSQALTFGHTQLKG